MSVPIISVENLGKKYLIDHQAQHQRYTALRDVIAEKAKGLIPFRRSTQDPNGRPRTEEFWALKNVSFEIHQGEVVGIIGRNGAGKSTLLKILSRITEPTTGLVRLRGRVASLLEVGTGFHPELTGRENIFLNGAILGMTRAEIRRKFDEIVAFAEVAKFLDTPVKRYSSGMYVRLAFAVAAHLEPEILVVDEVLAVGDMEFQKKCLGKMHEVSKIGRTVLFVSHNMSAVQSLCGAGVLLDRGQLQRKGSVGEVIGDYLAGLRDSPNPDGAVDLGPGLRVGQLELSPRAIESGGPMSIHVRLIPKAPTVIKELALLIHSDYGTRVAVMDLRREGLCNLELHPKELHPKELHKDDALDFSVHVNTLPLVEGDYRFGFYLATTDYQAESIDVAVFSVGAARQPRGVVPYAAQYRGFVELDFSVEQHMARVPETFSV